MTAREAPPTPLAGLLHVYDVEHRLTCFESGPKAPASHSAPSAASPPNCVIFVGGLGDGLAAIPVLPELSDALYNQQSQQGEWSLVQVLTRSSYLGWTTGSIDRDVEDLITLERYLRTRAGKSGKLVLFGHSTGCQDIVRLFQLHGHTTSYNAAILQAPVSDREYAADSTPADDFVKTIASAREQSKAGGGAFPMSWQALDIINEDQKYKDPISADRWLSLVTKGGAEDFFSSDLDEPTLKNIFAGLRNSGKHVLFLMSGKDECVPKHVNIEELTRKFVEATSGGSASVRGQIVENAGHSVESEVAKSQLTHFVLDFIKTIP